MRAGAAIDSIGPPICRRATPNRRYFRWRKACRHGLVDVIAAGHTHGGLAHQVNGIGIIQPFSRGQAFGRVDVVFDRRARSVARMQLFAPRRSAPSRIRNRELRAATESAAPAQYEGRAVTPDPAIVQAMAPALQRVHELQATTLGVSLDAPIRRVGDLGSPLGNLFADALRDAVPGADIAVDQQRGARSAGGSPGGPLTFGRLYDVFPFDNRIARINAERRRARRWLASEIRKGRRGGLGISGVGVRVSCVGRRHARRSRSRRADRIHETIDCSS